jgi:hypothetical protein
MRLIGVSTWSNFARWTFFNIVRLLPTSLTMRSSLGG